MSWYTWSTLERNNSAIQALSFLVPIRGGWGGGGGGGGGSTQNRSSGSRFFPLTLDSSFDGLHQELNTQELFSFVKMLEIQNVMMKAK